MVFGDGTFGRQRDHTHAQRRGHMRTQQDGGYLPAKKRSSPRTKSAGILILNLPASKNMRN